MLCTRLVWLGPAGPLKSSPKGDGQPSNFAKEIAHHPLRTTMKGKSMAMVKKLSQLTEPATI